jgi:hypothetical protein
MLMNLLVIIMIVVRKRRVKMDVGLRWLKGMRMKFVQLVEHK